MLNAINLVLFHQKFILSLFRFFDLAAVKVHPLLVAEKRITESDQKWCFTIGKWHGCIQEVMEIRFMYEKVRDADF